MDATMDRTLAVPVTAEADGAELHGLMGEFPSAKALVEAAEKAHAAGYRQMDAYSPYPIEHLAHVVADHKRSKVPLVCLVGGVTGALGGFALAYWTSVVDYPINVAGRPYNSWPAFIPIIFECTILIAAFSAGIGMLVLNRLPEPYHPVFNVERFREKASRDGYFLCIEAGDPRFDRVAVRDFLLATGAVEVSDVAR